MINILRALLERVGNMKQQMSNISSKIEILKKNQNKILEIKSTVTQMKNVSGEFIHSLRK